MQKLAPDGSMTKGQFGKCALNIAARAWSPARVITGAVMSGVGKVSVAELALIVSAVRPDWRPIVERSLLAMDPVYLVELLRVRTWLPTPPDRMLAAFGTVPLAMTRYILVGESPFPRRQSALGIAFLDGAVADLWSDDGGLSKLVNRATSLRNLIKAMLVAEGRLAAGFTHKNAVQNAYDTSCHVQTLKEVFENMYYQGVLPVNFTPVLRLAQGARGVSEDRKNAVWEHRPAEGAHWIPFWRTLFESLSTRSEKPTIVAFGKQAQVVTIMAKRYDFATVSAEHPYNLSFISNPTVLQFLTPLRLLERKLKAY